MWQNPQIVKKLKKNSYKIQKLELWQLKPSNWQETQKLKMWQNSKTQIVTKLKTSNCDKTQKIQFETKLKSTNCDKSQKLKLWQNKKLKLWQLKKSNCDKTQKLKLWQLKNSNSDTSTTDEMFLGQLSQFSQCFCDKQIYLGKKSLLVTTVTTVTTGITVTTVTKEGR